MHVFALVQYYPRHAFMNAAFNSRRVVTPDGVRPAAVLVHEGKITDVVGSDQIPGDYDVEDLGDLVLMPGLVDTHVHINEPGRTEWEGFETATKAAAAGGITTLVDMPLNSTPVTTTVAAFEEKLSAAKGKLHVDCGFYAGLIPGNNEHIQPLIEAGVFGVKAFLIHSGIDDFPNASEHDLRSAMPIIAKHNIPLLVHCELANSNPSVPTRRDEISSRHRRAGQSAIRPSRLVGTRSRLAIGEPDNAKSYREYLSSRPSQWELDAINLMITLSREYTCKVHIVHVSSADAIPALREARGAGLPLTTETCPHYLYFTAEEIPDGDTRFKCAPPIRENENRERLWKGLADGVLDFVVSDHSPSLPALKCLEAGDFQKAWGGIASLQFGLSIVWTEARKRGHSLMDIVEWMSHRPARFLGLDRKGKIVRGYDADFVIWDPDEPIVVGKGAIFHRHALTPYEGRSLYGSIKKTILHGKCVYDRREGFLDNPAGQLLLRTRTLTEREIR